MTIREKVIIKLVQFLIEFIGSNVEGFYSFKLDDAIRDCFKEKEDEGKNQSRD